MDKQAAGLVRYGLAGAKNLRNLLRGRQTKPDTWLDRTHGKVRDFDRSWKGQAASFGLLGGGVYGQMTGEPGSTRSNVGALANAAAFPLYAPLMALPAAIRTGKAATGRYDDKLTEAGMQGATQAGMEMMSGIKANPQLLGQGMYRQALGGNPEGQRLAQGKYQDVPLWAALMSGDADPMLRGRIQQKIGQGAFGDGGGQMTPEIKAKMQQVMGAMPMNKQARFKWLGRQAKNIKDYHTEGGWGKRTWRGLQTTGMAGVPAWLTGQAIAGGPSKNLVEGVQSDAYNATHERIAQEFDKMTPWQRRLAQFDPSLVANKVEQHAPGFISSWERATGQKHQPGILGGLHQAWTNKGPAQQYLRDNQGTRHYL